jgi:hypothetical protein
MPQAYRNTLKNTPQERYWWGMKIYCWGYFTIPPRVSSSLNKNHSQVKILKHMLKGYSRGVGRG